MHDLAKACALYDWVICSTFDNTLRLDLAVDCVSEYHMYLVFFVGGSVESFPSHGWALRMLLYLSNCIGRLTVVKSDILLPVSSIDLLTLPSNASIVKGKTGNDCSFVPLTVKICLLLCSVGFNFSLSGKMFRV